MLQLQIRLDSLTGLAGFAKFGSLLNRDFVKGFDVSAKMSAAILDSRPSEDFNIKIFCRKPFYLEPKSSGTVV